MKLDMVPAVGGGGLDGAGRGVGSIQRSFVVGLPLCCFWFSVFVFR